MCRDPHDQGEDGTMRPVVERIQGELVAGSNRLNKSRPILLWYRRLGLAIEDIAECCRPLPISLLRHDRQLGLVTSFYAFGGFHDGNRSQGCHGFLDGPI